MFNVKVILLLVASSLIELINTQELPEGFTTCSRSDPNFHECLAKAITEAFMQMKDGNSQYDIPAIEPYHIKFIESDTIGGADNFVLKSSVKDMNIHGFGKTEIKRVNTKFGKNGFALRAEAQGFGGSVKLLGQYTMKGKILVLPIDGAGKCNVTMIDPIIRIEMRGKYFEKNNETFMNTTSVDINIKPKKAIFYFENLFKNDKKLSETINSFMNENWELVVENLIPGYEKRLGPVFKDEANKIFHQVPMNKIFRD